MRLSTYFQKMCPHTQIIPCGDEKQSSEVNVVSRWCPWRFSIKNKQVKWLRQKCFSFHVGLNSIKKIFQEFNKNVCLKKKIVNCQWLCREVYTDRDQLILLFYLYLTLAYNCISLKIDEIPLSWFTVRSPTRRIARVSKSE